MNKLSSFKKLVMVILVALVLGLSTTVYATDVVSIDTGDEPTVISDQAGADGNNTIDDVNTVENEPEIEVDNEVPEEIPDTGKAENTVFIVIATGLVVSAIYTYAKIKKYNF